MVINTALRKFGRPSRPGRASPLGTARRSARWMPTSSTVRAALDRSPSAPPSVPAAGPGSSRASGPSSLSASWPSGLSWAPCSVAAPWSWSAVNRQRPCPRPTEPRPVRRANGSTAVGASAAPVTARRRRASRRRPSPPCARPRSSTAGCPTTPSNSTRPSPRSRPRGSISHGSCARCPSDVLFGVASPHRSLRGPQRPACPRTLARSTRRSAIPHRRASRLSVSDTRAYKAAGSRMAKLLATLPALDATGRRRSWATPGSRRSHPDRALLRGGGAAVPGQFDIGRAAQPGTVPPGRGHDLRAFPVDDARSSPACRAPDPRPSVGG